MAGKKIKKSPDGLMQVSNHNWLIGKRSTLHIVSYQKLLVTSWILQYNNMEIEFSDGEKRSHIVNVLIEFLAWIELMEKSNKKADMLVELENDFQASNFQITIQKKDKTIQEYVRLLKLTKQEYKKLFQENKILKNKLNLI